DWSSDVCSSDLSASCPVPALFHTLELSSAAAFSRSKIVISHSGSNRLINMASVELITPAPTNTTCLLDIKSHPILESFKNGHHRPAMCQNYTNQCIIAFMS